MRKPLHLGIAMTMMATVACTSQGGNAQTSTEMDVVCQFPSLKAEHTHRGYYMLGGPNPDTLVGGPNPDSTIVYHIKATLTNTSSNPIAFMSMSCSHEDMFVVSDFADLAIQPYGLCWLNTPIRISLAPQESYSKSIMIRPVKKALDKSVDTRIGFRYLEADEQGITFPEAGESYDYRHSRNEVVWSEPIRIEK